MKNKYSAFRLIALVIFIFLVGSNFETFAERNQTSPKLKQKVTKNKDKKPLVGYLKDGKWHFIDYDGNLLFEPKDFSDVLGYSEGFFRVNIKFNDKPKWAIVDLRGNVTVIDGINYLFDFKNGRALVAKKLKKENDSKGDEFLFGYINRNGKPIIPLIYEDATEFSEGLAFVKNKDFRGFIDTNNHPVIKMENSAGNKFTEGLADINDKRYRQGFMNKKGEIVIPLQFELLDNFSEGLAFAIKGDTIGYINKTGKFEFTVDGYAGKPFSDSMAFVGVLNEAKEMRWALINRNGERLTGYVFEEVRNFSEGVAAVKQNGRWFFIDKLGNEVLLNDYIYVDSFVDGIAWASFKDGKKGYINHKGEMVLQVPDAESYFDFRLNRKVY